MRRIVTAALTTVSSLVLLLAYPTSHNASTSPAADSPTDTTSSTQGTSTTAQATTYDGDAVATQWGTVQVRVTVQDGAVTAAEAIQYPNENPKDQQINAYALPILNQEAVVAQSASIDSVGGATVTSNGYVTSLQSALDAANL